jgi:hypothetical protein
MPVQVRTKLTSSTSCLPWRTRLYLMVMVMPRALNDQWNHGSGVSVITSEITVHYVLYTQTLQTTCHDHQVPVSRLRLTGPCTFKVAHTYTESRHFSKPSGAGCGVSIANPHRKSAEKLLPVMPVHPHPSDMSLRITVFEYGHIYMCCLLPIGKYCHTFFVFLRSI